MWILFVVGALAQAPPDLSGTWMLEYHVVSKNQLAIVGAIKSTANTFVLAQLTPTESGYRQDHQVCGSYVDGAIVRSELSAAYLAAVPRKHYAVTLPKRGDSLGFEADTGVYITGYDPAKCAAPPTSADDPCVIDWDGDGRPGATVKVKAPLFRWTDVYLAQRNHLSLSGDVVSADRIEGRLVVNSMATHVVGAANRLFARSPTADLLPEESRFAMKRMPDGADCAAVKAELARGSLLP